MRRCERCKQEVESLYSLTPTMRVCGQCLWELSRDDLDRAFDRFFASVAAPLKRFLDLLSGPQED